METLLFRRPRVFALAIVMIVALGVSALVTIARQEDPTITNLFATVTTPFPGAAPSRVEALVTEKIEEELRGISEIDEIRSTSRTGISLVQVELSDTLPDSRLDQVWSEIRDALSDAARTFPPGVPEPTFDDERTGAFTMIVAVTPREGAEVPPSVLRRHAEALQDRLRGVPATEDVRVYGLPEEEVLVTLNPEAAATLGLAARQVAAAIDAADAKVRAGQVRGPGTDLLIEVAGEITDLDRIRAIPLAAAEDGSAVRVGDVATVRRSALTPPVSIARSGQVPGVLVAARMQTDRQVDAWSDRAAEALDGFRATLPASLEAEVVFDQAPYTVARLSDLVGTMALGLLLVIGVLFLSLGWRAAMIVAAVIPLAALVAIAVMQRVGIPIHQMSVTGLIVALGLLVDAAIVMIDDIRRRLRRGRAAVAAVREAVRRLAVPLLASTATTVLAFLPMAMLPGPAGDFVGSIALAVIIMLVASLVLALTVTPALGGWILPAGEGSGDGMRPSLGDGIRRAFAATIRWSLRRPLMSVALSLVLPVLGFALFPTLTAQFFPGVDRDQFHVQLELPGGSAIAETERASAAAGGILHGTAGVVAVQWVVGESAPAFYYNMLADRDRTPHFAEALVTTDGPETTERLIPQLQRALDAALPEAQILVRGLAQGPPVAAPVEVRLVGPDLAQLRATGEDIRRLLSALPTVTHTRATLVGGAPKLVFRLDEDKVRQAGLTLGSVAHQLEALLEGAVGGSLLEATEELPVRVRVAAEDRADVGAVLALALVAPAASAASAFPGIPLAALGDWAVEPSDSPIARRNGERINTVQAYLRHGVLPEEALQDFRERMAASAVTLPPGVRMEFGGDSDARSETVANLVSTLGLVVTLTVATIVLTFMSYRLSAIALTVCGLSMGLSFLALAAFDYPFGIQALIGAIGSIGVAINAAIIVMTGLQGDPAAAAGDRDAMAAVVVNSARHIVSTTATTVCGFIPLILAGGGFWPPFAVAIAGGVLLSAVVSFYFTPPMFALATGRGGARRRPLEAPSARPHVTGMKGKI